MRCVASLCIALEWQRADDCAALAAARHDDVDALVNIVADCVVRFLQRLISWVLSKLVDEVGVVVVYNGVYAEFLCEVLVVVLACHTHHAVACNLSPCLL